MGDDNPMQVFRNALMKCVPKVARMTKTSIGIEAVDENAFYLVATWPATTAGPAGEYRTLFDRTRVFGGAITPPLYAQPVKRTCRFSNELTAAILKARGL